MDGSSTLHTLRWKQICAGALSAASLIAGHLVFGQDAPARRPAPASHPAAIQADNSGKSAADAPQRLAPILDARSQRQPVNPTAPASSKTATKVLPPIHDTRSVPKPARDQATFVPLPNREGHPDEQRPVATLELKPSSNNQPLKTPSSPSPWMVDINEALAAKNTASARNGKSESPTKGEPKPKDEQPATPEATAKSAPTSVSAETTKPSAGRGAFPVAQLGLPQPAPFGNMEPPKTSPYTTPSTADLRQPSAPALRASARTQSSPAPQFNPFIGSAATESKANPAPKAIEAASPEPPVADTFTAPPKTESKPAVLKETTSSTAESTAVALPAIEAAPEKETAAVETPAALLTPTEDSSSLPPVVAVEAVKKPVRPMNVENESQAAAPATSPFQAPIQGRQAFQPATANPIAAPRVEKTQHQRGSAIGNRLQLTGYETQDQALGNPEPTPAQPQLGPATGSKFTQAEAPRPLPGLPASPFQMIGESGTVSVMVRRSMLLRTQTDIYRTAVVDPGICEVIQFTPREISIIGKSQGSTHVTFWFDGADSQPITYLVKVEPDSAEVKKEEDKYKLLEDVVNEMFPDSKIQLLLVADKLIVKGQAKDSEEATQIMAIIRSNAGGGGGGSWGPGGWSGGAGGGLSEGAAADVLSDSATGSAARARYQVINMLRVPGVQQVALRVKIAELNRTAARGFGVDVRGNVAFSDSPEGTDLFFNSILNVAGGGAPALLAQFDGDDISVGIRYLQQQGVIRLLSEPTLVTMSGRPATFVAGGEFAVPTVVGSAGLNAVTTDFRAFGAIISFLPTVVDKDRIRLEVSPEFSQINQDIAVGGTPGLKTRAVTTTVEMREGQTFAIAGLLEDSMNGTTIGDLPFLAQIFGRRSMQRAETELIILVTPELVHAMEAEEVPPLPGFDVTEPDNAQFFLHGKIEGTPTREYRSTVWPRLKNRYKAGGPAMTSGPFGHGQ